MRHGRAPQGIAVIVLGSGLALPPVTAASAKQHAPSRHNSSTATLCAVVSAEQRSSSSVGLSIERAIDCGNFAEAKQAMLSAYHTDLNSVAKANGVVNLAHADVQAAFNGWLTFVEQIKTDIQKATTITSWFSANCSGSLSTTSSSIP